MEKFEKRQNPLLHRDPLLINAMHQNAIQFSKRETGETNRTRTANETESLDSFQKNRKNLHTAIHAGSEIGLKKKEISWGSPPGIPKTKLQIYFALRTTKGTHVEIEKDEEEAENR